MGTNGTTSSDDRHLLETILADVAPLAANGAVADYIPALAEVPADRLALSLCRTGGEPVGAGDCDQKFSIQSICKVFTLVLAMNCNQGERLWSRVGREPSGDPFNSMVLLEIERGVPRNPFINAGAIVVADILAAEYDKPVETLTTLISELAEAEITVDERVAESESATGYRNRSMANLMRSFGNLEGDVEPVLDVYFRQCSLGITANQLTRAIRFLANDGVDPVTGRQIVNALDARRINALMLMAGTYDAAGAFAYEVGIPCKSGVGGGIIGVVPDRAVVCAWSPPLDETGNSLAGRAALTRFVSRSKLSVF